MPTDPYREMMRYKRWATDGLNALLADNFRHLGVDERLLIRRLLDHIQVVDEIFHHHLEGRPHSYRAPRSDELPTFETLTDKAGAIGAWYVEYIDGLTPEQLGEAVDFTFTNGTPARMTRGDMILHVALHGAGHRAQIAFLLQKNGLVPFPDRITDFLEAETSGSQRQDSAKEIAR